MSRWNMTVPANLDTDTLVVVSEIADQLIQTYQVCQKSGFIYMSVKYLNGCNNMQISLMYFGIRVKIFKPEI